MEKRLKKLGALTSMALEVEMMKLQKLALAEKEKDDQIRELRASQTIRSLSLSDKGGSDLALYVGADQRWARWVQAKISELNRQKAALIASRQEQKLYTQKAYGKDEAVRGLIQKTQETARIERSRP